MLLVRLQQLPWIQRRWSKYLNHLELSGSAVELSNLYVLRMGSDKSLSDGLGSTRRAGRTLLAERRSACLWKQKIGCTSVVKRCPSDDCLRLIGCVRAIYMLAESRRIFNSNTFGNVEFRWWKCF